MSIDIKTTTFITNLSHDCRYRHNHLSFKNHIIGFVAQIEILFNDNWRPVVRYDTAHGFAHKDVIHYSGEIDKIPFIYTDYADALNFAQSDIRENWQKYKTLFLKEASNNE